MGQIVSKEELQIEISFKNISNVIEINDDDENISNHENQQEVPIADENKYKPLDITLESKVLEEVDLTQKQHSINSFQEPAVSDVIQMTYSTFDDKFFEMLESDLAVAKDDTSIALITSDDEDYQVIEIKDELPKSEIAVAKDEPTIAPITSDDEDCQVIEIKDELPKSSIKIIRNKYIRSKNQRNMKVQLKALRKIRKLKKAYDELILMELDHNFSKCMIKIDQIHKKIIEIAAKNDLFHKIPEFLRKPKRVIRH